MPLYLSQHLSSAVAVALKDNLPTSSAPLSHKQRPCVKLQQSLLCMSDATSASRHFKPVYPLQGGGYLTCGNCAGNGSVPVAAAQTTARNGGEETCPFCSGTGKVMCTACLVCSTPLISLGLCMSIARCSAQSSICHPVLNKAHVQVHTCKSLHAPSACLGAVALRAEGGVCKGFPQGWGEGVQLSTTVAWLRAHAVMLKPQLHCFGNCQRHMLAANALCYHCMGRTNCNTRSTPSLVTTPMPTYVRTSFLFCVYFWDLYAAFFAAIRGARPKFELCLLCCVIGNG